MEPAAAAWVPCNFQLANWNMDMEPAAWSHGFPSESETTEIYGTSWIQTCAPNNNSGGGPLVEYYASGTQHYYPVEKEAQEESFEVVLHNMETEIYNNNNPIRMLKEVARNFDADIGMIKKKIHRYPQSIRDLGDWYTVPRIVAIGPYHHSRQQLVKMEEVKRVAAHHCLRESDCSVPELLFKAIISAADDARRLYDKDAVVGISCYDFRYMMFFDACFLVQFMVWYTDGKYEQTPTSLRDFFCCNSREIYHDIWLLENQLPWSVVKAVMGLRPVNLKKFVDSWRHGLRDRQPLKEEPFHLDKNYQPPHLLGLLRHHIVGSSKHTEPSDEHQNRLRSISFSASAMELAEIGITLRANESPELADMGLREKEILFAELSLAPLSLNYARASRLVNMAAFELCTVPSFIDADQNEDSAVCSYLLLLSMLVHREDDVHELRRQGILEGGGGFTNKQVLDFCTSLQSIPEGSCYALTMIQIESYKLDRKMQTKAHSFWYKNKKTIFAVSSAIVTVVGIVGTLVTILGKLKPLKAAP